MIEVTQNNAAEVAKAVKAGELPGAAKTLAEALARIYADGGRYVQKTGQMQGVVRYSYAKEGDFIAAIRPLMETHGVTVRPVKYEVVTNEPFERKNGGTSYRVVVLATFEFLHSSGDKASAMAVGEGQDSGDKAFNKAMTAAMKYVLRQTFCIETGDDPDDTPSHEQQRAPAAKPAPAPAQPAKAAVPNNMQRRAFHTQAYAQAKDHKAFLAARSAVVADTEKGVLSQADVAELRRVDAETLARCPAPQPAKT